VTTPAVSTYGARATSLCPHAGIPLTPMLTRVLGHSSSTTRRPTTPTLGQTRPVTCTSACWTLFLRWTQNGRP
jgi:hypothetical protein